MKKLCFGSLAILATCFAATSAYPFGQAPPSSPPGPNPSHSDGGCDHNIDCFGGQICYSGQCVWQNEAPTPDPNGDSCSHNIDCFEGQVCVSGRCTWQN